jgi:hypothetical protein
LSKKKSFIVVGQNGIPCPRCGAPTEIREHSSITPKHLSQPYYYSRWFNCAAADCRTTLVMSDEFKVLNDPEAAEQAARLRAVREQIAPK